MGHMQSPQRVLPFHRLGVDFHPAHVGVSALTVTTARSEVDESDFVYLGKVHLVEQQAFGLNLLDVQLHPADIAKIELTFLKIEGVSVCMISHKKRPVG